LENKNQKEWQPETYHYGQLAATGVVVACILKNETPRATMTALAQSIEY